MGAERSNEEWLRLLSDAGDAAHEELRGILVQGLARTLSRRGVPRDLLEDFAQEAMLRIRDRLDSFRGESRFTTWAASIAVRLAFDELRRARWRDVSFDALTSDAANPIARDQVTVPDQEKAIARARVLSALEAAIEGALTERQRTVLVAELRGMPHDEIARHLGIKRNALHKLSHDARRKVRVTLTEAGICGPDLVWAFE